MRILFIVDGEVDEPSARTRAHALIPALEEVGVQAGVLSTRRRAGAAGKRRLLSACREADLVVLQRVLPPTPALALMTVSNPILAFDFDDALYLDQDRRPRLEAILRRAQVVVAGSPGLARYAQEHTDDVTVIPTTVNPDDYAMATLREDARLRLGWLGTAGNLPFLEVIRPSLHALAREGADFTFGVICSEGPDWPELGAGRMTHTRWSLEDAPRALSALDVGLAPLPDTPWCRGKCGLKVVEYMAAGLPVVASPVGASEEIVITEETGLLARTPEDWTAALRRLAGAPELRARMGARGRQRVEERYSTGSAAAAWREVAERALTKSRPSRAGALSRRARRPR